MGGKEAAEVRNIVFLLCIPRQRHKTSWRECTFKSVLLSLKRNNALGFSVVTT